MSALSIQPTYPIFTETDGQPLEDGYIWIGQTNLDPQVNPINVYFDAALTVPAGQPIRTINGYPSRNGTPARLYVNSDYSIRVVNKNGSVVYSAPAATERYSGVVVGGLDSTDISFTQLGTGAVERTIADKGYEAISAFDFMTDDEVNDVKSGATVYDVTAALQAAINAAINGPKKLYLPQGKYKTTAGLSFASPIRIFGDGFNISPETGTVIYATQASGAAIEFNNAVGSFDDGVFVENIMVVGTGSGSAVGFQFEGAVWPNSIFRNLTAKAMGSHGFFFVDCISANVENCRAQGNGGNGYRISQSNALRLRGCTSESNGSHGFEFTSSGIPGERVAPSLVQCLSEENAGHAIYINQYTGVQIAECYLQVAALVNTAYSCVYIDNSTDIKIFNNQITSNVAWPLFAGVQFDGALYCQVIGNSFRGGFVNGQDVVEDATSGRNIVFANSGNGAQGSISYTTASATGSVYQNQMGSGANYGNEWFSGYHAFCDVNRNEIGRFQSDGLFLGSDGTGISNIRLYLKSESGGRTVSAVNSSGATQFYSDNDNATAGSPNAADSILFFFKNSVTNRSINAAGTVNASGADYAEYMTKRIDCGEIAKGQICGVDENGMLTDRFDLAHSFVIKSTDPSYVGGDTWGSEELIGSKPEAPIRKKRIVQEHHPVRLPGESYQEFLSKKTEITVLQEEESEQDYLARMDQYQTALESWQKSFDAARAKVDRIAFAGQVPAIVDGAFKVGDYIIASRSDSGGILAVAVESPTYEQYAMSVGKIWTIKDSKAWVAVKVS